MYGSLESTGSSSGASSENVIGYINGIEYTGEYHLMPNGMMMTGASHGSGTDQIIYSTIAESTSSDNEIPDLNQSYPSTGNPTVNIDYGSGSGVVTTPGYSGSKGLFELQLFLGPWGGGSWRRRP